MGTGSAKPRSREAHVLPRDAHRWKPGEMTDKGFPYHQPRPVSDPARPGPVRAGFAEGRDPEMSCFPPKSLDTLN